MHLASTLIDISNVNCITAFIIDAVIDFYKETCIDLTDRSDLSIDFYKETCNPQI